MQPSPPLDGRGRTGSEGVCVCVCVCLLRDQPTAISVNGQAKGFSFTLLT